MIATNALPLLQVVDLCFRYRAGGIARGQALESVSFDLFAGETLGVIGSNGAGKSTLLRLLTGVMAPTSGLVVKSHEVRCGLLSLGIGFMADLTGADNVVISLMLQGLTKNSATALLPEIHEFSELGAAFYERVRTYSTGMRSRLTFSAALHTQSEILLIDEVLAVGDAAFKKKARAAITDKIRSDQTVVYVSHSLQTVSELCDRVLWLDKGRMKMCGPSREVLAAYQQALQ